MAPPAAAAAAKSGLSNFTAQAQAAMSTIASSLLPKPGHEFLVTSPYVDSDHQLDLGTLSIQDQCLARALTIFDAQRTDYATAPYDETFNLDAVVARTRELSEAAGHHWTSGAYYIVAFRSQIPQTTDYAHLGELDKAAHYEAMKSGGFLKYWFGAPDAQGRNLATCIWRHPDDARRGSVGVAHRKAAGATRQLYTEWHIQRLRFTIHDGATSWSLADWDDEA